MRIFPRIDGHWFIDGEGRHCLLRGINLGGSSKVPHWPNGATHLPPHFQEHRQVSFVGRPFPLTEADEHFRRLRHWGFNCLRLLTTWEAIEHAGPGQYDEHYLDYLREVVIRAGNHDFAVFIDPHQDVWSRMTGGDGAPGWTLELAGFDLTKLDASEAAITMAGRYPAYSTMHWHLNASRLACATLFTLFFAGERYAPGFTVDGVHIQDYLQDHFIQSVGQLAARLADQPHVLGYGSFNEPNPGFIGIEDLNATQVMWADGPLLTPFEAITTGSGVSTTVPWIQFDGFQPGQTGETTLNPEHVSAWRSPEADIWRRLGIWRLRDDGTPELLKPDAFAGPAFFADCLRPFILRYARVIRSLHPGSLIFVEGQPGSTEPIWVGDDLPIVNASHWYDILTLHTKHYNPDLTLEWGSFQFVEGKKRVRELFAGQIGMIADMSKTHLHGAPTLIGEFGVPFDLDGGAAFDQGHYPDQIEALGIYYDALDAHLAHATLWNYTPDNDHLWGDQWNREDLSVYSRDDAHGTSSLDEGGRAIEGFCRPCLVAAAGLPLRQAFDRASGLYSFEMEVDGRIEAPSLFYVPLRQYPSGCQIEVSSGEVDYNKSRQSLEWTRPAPGPQRLTIIRLPKDVNP